MTRRVDPGHDPERFYHCDCLSGGYNPHAEERDRLEAERDRYETALRRIVEIGEDASSNTRDLRHAFKIADDALIGH